MCTIATGPQQQQQTFYEDKNHDVFDTSTEIQQSQSEMRIEEEEMQIGPIKSENRTFLEDSRLSVLTGI